MHFEADVTHVVVSKAAFEMKLPGAKPVLGDVLTRAADALLEKLPRGNDVTTRVRILLGGELELTEASAPRIAKRLGMSVRTLSRKLAFEGTSFRAQLDHVRKQIAMRELAHGGHTLVEIADRLGFATSRAFHRAFKRWTGTTATQMRKASARKSRRPR